MKGQSIGRRETVTGSFYPEGVRSWREGALDAHASLPGSRLRKRIRADTIGQRDKTREGTAIGEGRNYREVSVQRTSKG